ncbi:uncharacterized protein K444DRAFT_625422 [Hyaloscypha bicolor E]|uniref:BTB domain-containing protein n=1 Tax=Hyaloscypha bicolor E TaxID=1095630 RepID=A0A2J6TP43_9HELO|nr:uncharacterized protein K444DRAFT_625422 [Hyaloscypha bicolor E]PMD64785.1 hypothetical protein K444DRAFT_625422 [Hyaloscypha bicolor E]
MADQFSSNPRFVWEGPEFKEPVELVAFVVGKDGVEETIPVHKEHACYYSPVLKAAFTSSFVEGQTQTYRVEDTDPDIFRLLIQWFYKQTFKHSTANSAESIIEEQSIVEVSEAEFPSAEIDSMYLNMVKLWILAERLIIPRLQNFIMDSLVEMSEESWSTLWMATAYESTSSDSPLRRFAVDVLLYQVPAYGKKQCQNHFPRELLVDLACGATLSSKSGSRYVHTRLTRDYMVPEGSS